MEGGCSTILPNKTHRALLDLFLGRAGDWLGNKLVELTHTAGLSRGLHRPDTAYGGASWGLGTAAPHTP